MSLRPSTLCGCSDRGTFSHGAVLLYTRYRLRYRLGLVSEPVKYRSTRIQCISRPCATRSFPTIGILFSAWQAIVQVLQPVHEFRSMTMPHCRPSVLLGCSQRLFSSGYFSFDITSSLSTQFGSLRYSASVFPEPWALATGDWLYHGGDLRRCEKDRRLPLTRPNANVVRQWCVVSHQSWRPGHRTDGSAVTRRQDDDVISRASLRTRVLEPKPRQRHFEHVSARYAGFFGNLTETCAALSHVTLVTGSGSLVANHC